MTSCKTTVCHNCIYCIMWGHKVSQSFSLCFRNSFITPLLGFMSLSVSITQCATDSFLSIFTLQCSDMPLTFIAALCLCHECFILTLRVFIGVRDSTKCWLAWHVTLLLFSHMGPPLTNHCGERKSAHKYNKACDIDWVTWTSEKYKKIIVSSSLGWVLFHW